MYISQSQINLYRKCPYAYCLKYKHKHQPMFFDETNFEVGRKVHEVIDNYYTHYYTSVYSTEEVMGILYPLLQNCWDTNLPVNDDKKCSLYRKAYICLQHFAQFEIQNQQSGFSKPMTEVKIEVNGLLGYIDYINFDTMQVLDLKTNTKPTISYAYKIQFLMYKRLLKQKYNIDINEFDFLFLYPNELKTITYDKKLKKIEQDLDMFINQIQTSWKTGIFKKVPRTKSTCNSCEYRFYCGGINVE